MSGSRVGQTLGTYRLLELIGEGGMAEVYLAEMMGADRSLRRLALKVMRADLAKQQDLVDMLMAEAKIAVRLRHPNVVHAFELGRLADTFFLSMEYVDGPDLSKLLNTLAAGGRSLSTQAALYIITQMLSGLEYAHGLVGDDGQLLGLVHRDITPPNILLSQSGDVKIADFGIARITSQPGSTMAGVIKGRLDYMSPEQSRGQPLDRRSDVFASGLALYVLLTTRPLYPPSMPDSELLARVRDPQIAPPSTVRPDLPPQLDQVMARATATDPDDRYGSAAEFQLALQKVAGQLPSYDAADLSFEIQSVLAGDDVTQLADEAELVPVQRPVDLMGKQHFLVHQDSLIVEVDPQVYKGYESATVVDMRLEDLAALAPHARPSPAAAPTPAPASADSSAPGLVDQHTQFASEEALLASAEASAAPQPASALTDGLTQLLPEDELSDLEQAAAVDAEERTQMVAEDELVQAVRDGRAPEQPGGVSPAPTSARGEVRSAQEASDRGVDDSTPTVMGMQAVSVSDMMTFEPPRADTDPDGVAFEMADGQPAASARAEAAPADAKRQRDAAAPAAQQHDQTAMVAPRATAAIGADRADKSGGDTTRLIIVAIVALLVGIAAGFGISRATSGDEVNAAKCPPCSPAATKAPAK